MDKRNMPYSLEAEQSVLGAAFISKYDCGCEHTGHTAGAFVAMCI